MIRAKIIKALAFVLMKLGMLSRKDYENLEVRLMIIQAQKKAG